MSGFQIIESLCALAEEQNAIIRAMNLRLGELGVAFGEDELAAADEHYRRLLGRETSRKGVIPVIQIDIGEMFLAFIAAMGIPSAIMGLVVWRLKGRIEEKEVAQAERTKAQQDLFLIIVQSTRASIALGEATAKAVQRIPDAHCNGDMHSALEYATSIKHKQKEFLDKQGISALLDD